MKKLLLAAIITLVAAPAASAQTYIKTRVHTDAMAAMGQTTPAKDETLETWIGADTYASGSGNSWLIVDTAKQAAYFVNHKDKSYVETALPIDFAKLLPPELAPMAAMIQMTATVKPTTETKRIGTWNCTGYDVALTMMGMPLSMRIWATTDVPFDVASFNAKVMPTILQGEMRMAAAAVGEFAKIKGYQIASETTGNIMGADMHVTQEVVEITQKPAPAGIFAPPAGYTKKTTLSVADIRK